MDTDEQMRVHAGAVDEAELAVDQLVCKFGHIPATDHDNVLLLEE
jgi:hypothetical protein